MALTTVQAGILATPAQYTAMKNRLINGDFRIDQRNAGAAVTVNTAGAFYATDRFRLSGVATAGVFTGQQSTTAPAGFVNSLKITTTTSANPAAGDSYYIAQGVEGYNAGDLNWGTANAKTVTLSFWVQSSLTGTFGGSLSNQTVTRSYPFTYSIPVANTWTQISVTIPGDTAGTWDTSNLNGIRVYFGLGVGATFSGTAGAWAGAQYVSATGATSVVSTNGATFYITGVQLEVGSSATGYEYRQYQQELALCQRYYYSAIPLNSGSTYLVPAFSNSAAIGTAVFSFPVTMRTAPTLVSTTGTNYYNFYIANIDRYATSVTLNSPNVNYASVYATISGATAGQAGLLYVGSNSTSINFSAEL